MKTYENEGLLTYLEFLLMKQLMEPIIDNHVKDPLIVGASYDAICGILSELEKSLEDQRIDILVDRISKK